MSERLIAAARVAVVGLLGLALETVAPQAVRAQDCWIGLKAASATSTPVSVDGVKSTGEWDDASLIQSGDDCFDVLWDWDASTFAADNHAIPTLSKIAQVYSKRDNTNLYFLFLVQDQTQNTLGGGALSRGEKIIIEIDPDSSRLDQLSIGSNARDADYRLDFTHKWSAATAVKELYKSVPSVTCSDGVTTRRSWNAGSTGFATDQWNNTLGLDAALNTTGVPGQYGVEFKVPLSALGLPTTGTLPRKGLGIAFAVINQLGNNRSGTTNDATAASFPNTIGLTNASGLVSNLLDPLDCGAWLSEANWGGGYFITAPTDVTISRQPVSWLSSAIKAFDCTAPGDTSGATENYLWYKDNPCKVTVRATVRNTGTVDKTRHLVFLMGRYDAGVGWAWTTLDVQRVTVPAAVSPTPPPRESEFSVFQWNVPNDLWNTVAHPNPNHPCLRVYILPENLRPDFDEAAIRGMLLASAATLADLESKYGVADDHWAQKNLTMATGSTMCPGPAKCPSAYLDEPPGFPFAAALDLGFGRLMRALAPSPLLAQDVTAARDTAGRILWTPADQRRFGEGNVIVQVQTVGYVNPPAGQTPPYNFIEHLGGVVKVFPGSMVTEDVTLPLEFDVTNYTDAERTISLKVDQQVPAGLQGVRVVVDTRPQTYGPGQTRTIKGVVTTKPPAIHFTWWLLLVIVVVLLMAYVLWKARTSP